MVESIYPGRQLSPTSTLPATLYAPLLDLRGRLRVRLVHAAALAGRPRRRSWPSLTAGTTHGAGCARPAGGRRADAASRSPTSMRSTPGRWRGAQIVVGRCASERFGQRHFMVRDPTGLVLDVISPMPREHRRSVARWCAGAGSWAPSSSVAPRPGRLVARQGQPTRREPVMGMQAQTIDVVEAIYTTGAQRRLRPDICVCQTTSSGRSSMPSIEGAVGGNGQRWRWLVVTERRPQGSDRGALTLEVVERLHGRRSAGWLRRGRPSPPRQGRPPRRPGWRRPEGPELPRGRAPGGEHRAGPGVGLRHRRGRPGHADGRCAARTSSRAVAEPHAGRSGPWARAARRRCSTVSTRRRSPRCSAPARSRQGAGRSIPIGLHRVRAASSAPERRPVETVVYWERWGGNRDRPPTEVHDEWPRRAADGRAQARAATRSTITFDEPPGCIVTPSRQSPASIVRFWWLTIEQLRLAAELGDQAEEAVQVDVVERGLDLVHHVERRRPAAEHGEQERQRGQAALAARQQRELLDVLAARLGLDLDAGVEQVVGLGEHEPPAAAREQRRRTASRSSSLTSA